MAEQDGKWVALYQLTKILTASQPIVVFQQMRNGAFHTLQSPIRHTDSLDGFRHKAFVLPHKSASTVTHLYGKCSRTRPLIFTYRPIRSFEMFSPRILRPSNVARSIVNSESIPDILSLTKGTLFVRILISGPFLMHAILLWSMFY